MLILSTIFFVGLVVLSIAVAGWLHIGCNACASKV